MSKEVPDGGRGLRLINLISVTLARLVMFCSQCHLCMRCGAAESTGNLLLPAGSGPGWMPVHGFLWDGTENLNTLVWGGWFTAQPLSVRTDARIASSW